MIVVCSDTHARSDPGLTDHLRADLAEASLVLHTGDFTTEAVLESFHEFGECHAVHGNADDAAVRDRLPETRTLEYGGARIALTHRRDGGATGLAMFGRARDADLVLSGHTHRPTVADAGELTLVNPGSHAQPRGNRPGYATLSPTDGGLDGRLLEPDGTVIETFELRP